MIIGIENIKEKLKEKEESDELKEKRFISD